MPKQKRYAKFDPFLHDIEQYVAETSTLAPLDMKSELSSIR